MKSIISDREWYILTQFAYTTNFGRISEPASDMNELSEIARSRIEVKNE